MYKEKICYKLKLKSYDQTLIIFNIFVSSPVSRFDRPEAAA